MLFLPGFLSSIASAKKCSSLSLPFSSSQRSHSPLLTYFLFFRYDRWRSFRAWWSRDFLFHRVLLCFTLCYSFRGFAPFLFGRHSVVIQSSFGCHSVVIPWSFNSFAFRVSCSATLNLQFSTAAATATATTAYFLLTSYS